MVELITVMVLLGVLAAIGVPKLIGDNDTGAIVFGDQVVSTLRTAQKTAVARRRLVCMTANVTGLTAQLRSAPGNGDGTCSLALDSANAANNKITLAGAPAQLFFHPDGTIATSAGGAPVAALVIRIEQSGTPRRTIRIEGSTGYVD